MIYNRKYIEERIREFLEDALDHSTENVGLDQNLFSEIGLDSIGITMVFVEISLEFEIPEPEDEEILQSVDTISKLVDYTLENIK